MKKDNIISLVIIFLGLLLFSSCRKETSETTGSSESTALRPSHNGDGHRKGCRLTDIVWGDGSTWHFHYNNKGLADQWLLDFGDGLPHDFRLKYDKYDRLIRAYDHYNSTIYTYIFIYHGKRLIKQTWSNNVTPDGGEIVNTYNRRGQIERRDDKVNDIHAVFTHNRMGNSPHLDFYIGKDLAVTGDFTFKTPNKNPLLTVNGLDIGFFYYSYGLWDRWWETSDRYVTYDNGTPTVVLDYDPHKTVMHFGKQHYLSSVDYFDRVTNSPAVNTLTYENCPGGCDPVNVQAIQANANASAKNSSRLMRSLLLIPGSAKSIKQKIKELKN